MPEKAEGIFSRDQAYLLSALRARGIGSEMIRQLQRGGMKAHKLGKAKVVLGSDLLDAFAQLPVETLTPREKR